MAKLGQIKSGTMRVGNTTASGYGIVYADEIIGHRRVNTYDDLANIPDWSLYNKAGGETTSAAIGQLWYVTTGDDSGHSAGLYQLTAWSDNTKTWKFFKNGADVSIPDTTYKFENGSNGTFNVTLPGGTVQSVSIGKPENAQHADLADGATRAATATVADSATKATQDEKGNNIVNTYATKSDVQALSHALIYKGTIGTNGTITRLNVPAQVGDVYVAVAGAPAVNGVALEPGDMIIAKTAGDGTTTHATWTAVQTNINGAVTASSELGASKLIVGSGNKSIHAADGTGFVKIENGIVSTDNSTYLESVPKATTNKVGGGKVVNVYDGTASISNTDPDSSDLILEGLQIDSDGSFYTPVIKYTTATVSRDGLMSSGDKKKLDTLQNYTLKAANTDSLGGIKIGFTKDDTNKNYPVQLSGDKAYVHVPWVDTNTTYPLASESVNGLMSSSDKAKLNRIQYPTDVLTSQLDLCGFEDYATLVNAVANQKDGLSFWVGDQNAIVTLQTDNGKHAIIQTIRTATELNDSWEFATGATSSHTDGVLFTYQRFYPIGGTYSTDTCNKWTKWAIIDVDTMYTANRSNMNSVYKQLGKQLLSNLSVDTNGKITFSSTYSGTNTEGIKSQSKDILTPISNTEITTLFN